MKILLINFTDAGGGAAIAAYRLAEALHKNGIEVTLGVVQKKSEASFVVEIPKKNLVYVSKRILNILNKLIRIFFPFMRYLFFRTTNNILHSTNSYSLIDVNWINNLDCDVVNIHWIGNNMLSIKDIGKIKKPIVWTMHDSWPCCGAEHHPNIAEADTRWKEGYYRYNKPATSKGIDLCRKVWKQKKKYLGNKGIMFTAPSHWEHDVLKASDLFGHCKCEVIPNIIDHTVFYPRDKNLVRNLMGIPSDKTIIGFGAAYDIDNPKSMKGSYYLVEALQKLKNPENFFIVIFGPASDMFMSRIQLPFFAAGYISNPSILANIYSLCDVVVNPSLIENLPTTCLESISCGVPVVAFDVGGTSDIVVHKDTGWLATPYKSEELALGVKWCMENIEQLSKKCVEKAKKDFNEEETVKKYINVFKEALKI